MYDIVVGFLTFLAFIGYFTLSAMSCALHKLHKKDSKKEFKNLKQLFPYRSLHLWFFPYQEYDGVIFAVNCALTLCRITLLVGISLILLPYLTYGVLSYIGTLIALVVVVFTFFEFLPKIFGNRFPVRTLHICAQVASLFLAAALPITYLFLKIAQAYWHKNAFNVLNEFHITAKNEIIEIIQEADLSSDLNPHEKKLIESVVSFKDRIAREVMVPRVDLFCLKSDTTIKDATKLLENEGYSRTPVYRQSIDDIIGVLMYKDILAKYKEYEQLGNQEAILNAPIETILKNVLYTPETKKISNLLQEFRKKQVHLAIVVDEYGGTEGIVTIEDILEEIVGEIEDEYDEEEDQFVLQPDGSWIVDGRMSILDIDEQLGIKIPQEGDYDTIGGYIFHHAGSIPSKGFVIHHDDFTLEIFRSNDRFVEKVKIKPLKNETVPE